MMRVDIGMNIILKGRFVRLSQPSFPSRYLDLRLGGERITFSSQIHCALFQKGRQFNSFTAISKECGNVCERFHAECPSSLSTSCHPNPRSRRIGIRFLPLLCYRTYRTIHNLNQHGHKNNLNRQDQRQSQQFYDDSLVASFLSISALFAIYYLWKNYAHDDGNQLFRVAHCLSHNHERKVNFSGESVDGNSTKVTVTDVSSNILSRTPSQNKEGVYSGIINGKVDEMDTLSLGQAVEKVEDLLEKRKAEVGSPGIVVCVSVDGNFVYAKGFGHADVENQVPIHPHSVIRIASISKAMTAAMVAKLVDEGKINLDESVYHYVPKFPRKEFLGEKVDITVRQLLSHTSGIRSYWLDNDPVIALQVKLDDIMTEFDTGIQHLFHSNQVKNPPKKQIKKKKKIMKKTGTSLSTLPFEYYQTKEFSTTTKALKMFSEDRLVAKPDTKFVYSTLAYTLLAAVVESVTKKSFTSLAQETFCLWGLKETYLDQNDPLIYNRARHYQKMKGTLINVPYINVSYKWAGGGFLSSVMDAVKFGNILLYSSQHGDDDSGHPGYLKQSTVQEFWASIENKRNAGKYGLGFELIPAKTTFGMCSTQNSLAGHSGAAVGASSHVLILPREQTQTKVDNTRRMNKSVESSLETSASGSKEVTEDDTSKMQSQLPRGVVVAVIVNLIGVNLKEVTVEIARIFERVVLD